MRVVKTIGTALALGVCAATLLVGARPQDPSQPPRFKTGIDVVQLDVTVLDSNRRPVRGLTAADFTVLEDGKPQPVVGLAEIVLRDPEAPPAAWMRDVAPDVRTNDIPAEGRLIVLVMDDATMPTNAQMISSAKQIGRKVVDSMGPDDLVAVVYTLKNGNSQDFTSDRGRLLKSIDRFAPGFAYTVADRTPPPLPEPVFADDFLYQTYSIGTVSRAAEFLRAIPNRRKTLIYVSTGIPIDPETASTPVTVGLSAAGGTMASTFAQQDLIHDMQDAFGQALKANVNIYGVDPSGLGGMENFLQTTGVQMFNARRRATLHAEFLRTISDNSGGRAILDTNEFDRAIADVFRENSSYYLVGYQTPKPQQDGKFRRLEVRVNRPGVTVQSRNGYYAARPPKPRKANEPEPSPLVTAMAGFLPKGDVPMQTAAVPFAIPGKKEAAVVIVARLQHPPVEKRTVQQVELITSAFDALGRAKESRGQTARIVLLPADGTEVEYEVLSRIDLKPGQYNLRIASHNPALGKSGSVYNDVDVPDFSKDGVSLSGVVLSAAPGLPAAPRDALSTLLPLIPTTVREFEKDD
jgi:VWFA-related protein